MNKDDGYLHGDELFRFVVKDTPDDLPAVVTRLVFALGFKPKLVGTLYLKNAILCGYCFRNQPRVIYSKLVYPAVAKHLCTVARNVERDIRHTIEDCARYGNLYAFNDIMKGRLSEGSCPPSNIEFISAVVGWLSEIVFVDDPNKGNPFDDDPAVNIQ